MTLPGLGRKCGQSMTNQAYFPEMEPPVVGRMHEQTFNVALAEALRTRRKAWRENESAIIYERTAVFSDAQYDRPDILVQTPDIYPVVLEIEFGDPAFGDARKRLGKRVANTTFTVRSAIAIGAPLEVRHYTDAQLGELLSQPDGLELKLAILSANVEGTEGELNLSDSDVHSWPATGYVTGNLEDLAVLCEYAAAPPQLVSQTAKSVAADINNYAAALFRVVSPDVAREIAQGLGQTDLRQGLRMACCIWLTSLRLQNLLADTSSTLREYGLRTISEMKAGYNVGRVIVPDELRAEWGKILDVNYSAIFGAARNALHPRLPEEEASRVLTELSNLATRITALRLGNRVDFAGELFPELLSDREETAAHYTLPETAELLSQLAVGRLTLDDWETAEEVAALKIADLACGTGSLLRAAYRHIIRRHDVAGGTGEELHRRMMEESIVGLDINTLAAHMTAAGLSVVEIETEYHNTNIAAVGVVGGKTGSLELLVSEQITDVTGESATTATDDLETPTNIEVFNNSRDLIIQNPPYSRARGNRKAFDLAGISELERQRSMRRLTGIRDGLRRKGVAMSDAQAGLGADFSALANRKLKPGGVFATVLPLTAAHAETWQEFRTMLEAGYENIVAISFASHEGSMMSAETNMNEMLVIGTKREGDKPADEATRVLCVNLNQAPESIAEAYWYAKLLRDVGQPERGGNVIYDMGRQIGSWFVAASPSPGFPWLALGMQNHHLARTVAELFSGRFYSPQDMGSQDLSLSIAPLGGVVEIGPTHHLIGHIRGREDIGAFTFDRLDSDQIPTYPALWGAVSQNQRTIITRPTHEGQYSG